MISIRPTKAPMRCGHRAVTYSLMLPVQWIKGSTLALAIASASAVGAQDSLTLDQALKLARTRNGNLAAAAANVEAAKARARQSYAAFLPTLTPSFSYSDQKREQLTGFRNTSINSGITTEVEARWKILDAGQRDLNYTSARRALDAQALSALQTIRSTLVTVYTQYFDALRTQELVKVADAQVQRAKDGLAQTEAQIKVGDAAEKDRFQPEADSLNAQVDRLSAEARRRAAEASLKATIGYDMRSALPALEKFEEPSALTLLTEKDNLSDLIKEGLTNRADLNADRKRLESQNLGVRLAKIDAGIAWSVDVTYNKQFNADNVNNRTLGVFASFPLYDGGRSRAAVREAEASREGSSRQLEQAERSVEAEIESSYYTHRLNFDRVKAARAALEAARVNYQRVSRAKELGAQGADVVAVSTAQVTLTTAERNYVEAIYDFYISEVQLQLSIGRPIRGEEPIASEREE